MCGALGGHTFLFLTSSLSGEMQMISVSSLMEVGVEVGFLGTAVVLNTLTGSHSRTFKEHLMVMSPTP